MPDAHPKIRHRPNLKHARMVMGFSGWMDGGEVSIGTIEYLVDKLDAQPFAEIAPGPFYIYNFPGSMEMSSLFRPRAVISEGLVTQCEEPRNTFYVSEAHNLVLFRGKEPNLRWDEFAASIFSLAEACDVVTIYFIGSVASLVPHTRGVRFRCAVSEECLRPVMGQYGIEPVNYEGPGSFVTHLTMRAREKGLQMASLVAEVPAYVEGRNVKCIEAAAHKLAALMNLPVDLGDLESKRSQFEKRMDEAVEARPELGECIRRLEEDYDSRESDTELADVRSWFKRQGIELN